MFINHKEVVMKKSSKKSRVQKKLTYFLDHPQINRNKSWGNGNEPTSSSRGNDMGKTEVYTSLMDDVIKGGSKPGGK